MMKPLYRAWRFTHPDFDMDDEFSGIRNSSTGGIEMVEDQASIRQAILLLLTTIPGERVMRPHYGCDLHKLVFSPNDPTTHGLAIYYVRQALLRWEPRIEITRLDATHNAEDTALMDIFLEYRVRRTSQREHLTVSVQLTGETR